MELNKEFVLREVAGNWVVLPVGQAGVNFNGMISLNGTGAFLWQTLEKGADREALATALTEEYEVSKEQALQDVDAFLASLAKVGCLTD